MAHVTIFDKIQHLRGSDFERSLRQDVSMSASNMQVDEAPWDALALYVISLERRVCELESARTRQPAVS